MPTKLNHHTLFNYRGSVFLCLAGSRAHGYSKVRMVFSHFCHKDHFNSLAR